MLNHLANSHCDISLTVALFTPVESALGRRQAVVSEEELRERARIKQGDPVVVELRHFLQYSGSLACKCYLQTSASQKLILSGFHKSKLVIYIFFNSKEDFYI